jgi:hypothetical protein
MAMTVPAAGADPPHCGVGDCYQRVGRPPRALFARPMSLQHARDGSAPQDRVFIGSTGTPQPGCEQALKTTSQPIRLGCARYSPAGTIARAFCRWSGPFDDRRAVVPEPLLITPAAVSTRILLPLVMVGSQVFVFIGIVSLVFRKIFVKGVGDCLHYEMSDRTQYEMDTRL